MGDAIAFFDAIANRYDREYVLDAATTRIRMARLIDEVRAATPSGSVNSSPEVLDLGIGTGRELPALLDADFRVTGFDVSVRMLAQCAKRARPVPLVQGDFFATLPFIDRAFDAVLALHGTLAHPPDEGAFARLIDELARILRPGGLFVAEVPSPGWLELVGQGGVDDGRRAASRIAPDRIRHEDRVSHVSIEARVMDEPAWRALLEPQFDVRIEPLSPVEQLLLARLRTT